jgi:hypothetical protein
MDHAYFRDKVSAYHDRELPAQEQEMLEQHVASCPECQKLLAELERLDSLIAEKIDLGESDYWEKSAQKIEEKLGFTETAKITPVPTSRWDRGMVWKLSAVAASVALLVFIGINKDSIMKQPTEPPALMDVKPPTDSDAESYNVQPKSDSVDARQEIQSLSVPAQENRPVEQKKSAVGKTDEKDKVVIRGGRSNKDAIVIDSNVQRLPAEPDAVIQKLPTETPKTESREESEAPAPASKVAGALDELKTVDQKAEAESIVLAEEVTTDLSHWRAVRDSFATSLEKPKESLAQKYGVTKLRTDDRQKKSAAALTQPTGKDLSIAKARYLEACYQIALLTEDATEYQKSRGILVTESQSTDSTIAASAKDYLSKLAASRPTPPQK